MLYSDTLIPVRSGDMVIIQDVDRQVGDGKYAKVIRVQQESAVVRYWNWDEIQVPRERIHRRIDAWCDGIAG